MTTQAPESVTGPSTGTTSKLPPLVRLALRLGAIVGALLFLLHLLLALLGDCQQALHLALALINGGTALMMVRAAATGDPGGDTGTTGSGKQAHDDGTP